MSKYKAIVYVSSATWLMSADDLQYLLLDARSWNKAHGITGVLLYSDGNFIQCFAGEMTAVDECLKRILASKRHHGIQVLIDGPVDTPPFPDWLMGFLQPTGNEFLELQSAKWRDLQKNPTDKLSDSLGFQLLCDFCDLHAGYRPRLF